MLGPARHRVLVPLLGVLGCGGGTQGDVPDRAPRMAKPEVGPCAAELQRHADRDCTRHSSAVCTTLAKAIEACGERPKGRTAWSRVRPSEMTVQRMCDSFATEVPPAFCEGVFGIVQDVYGEDVFRERVLCRLRQLRIRDDENAFAVDCPDLLDIPDTATRAERERARTELGAVCALHPKACDVEGRCSAGFLGGNPGDADELRCVATAEGCRATKQCEVAGRCTPGKAASCVVASDADCVKSRVCTEWGHCTRAESGQAPPFGEVNARCVSKEEARELGDGRPWVHIVVSVEGEPKAPDAISLQAYAQLGAVRGCAQTTMEREPEADAREVRVTLDLREGKPQSVKASDPVAHRKPLEKCMRAAVGSMRFGKEEEPGVALKFTFDTRNHRDPALPPAWLSEMKAVDPSRL